jgi:hypothetical protein
MGPTSLEVGSIHLGAGVVAGYDIPKGAWALLGMVLTLLI